MRKPLKCLLAAVCLVSPLQSNAGAAAAATDQNSLTGPDAGKESSAFVEANAQGAVRKLAEALEDNFVNPDVGKAYAQMLRSNLAAGKYRRFPDAQSFAAAVTADLQTLHKDGHLVLEVAKAEPPQSADHGAPRGTSDVERSGWLADGVAYIRFKGFPGNEATLADVREFVTTYDRAKTLIIDARDHHGGGTDEMNLLFPHLFSSDTALIHLDVRTVVARGFGDTGEDEPFMRRIASPDTIIRREHYAVPASGRSKLRDAKVFVLVGPDTVSAGEHLALALKRTGRATLIGETTRGAGNFGMFFPVAEGYRAFVPFGRAFDPDTGEGWEGTGIKPDVQVAADKALDKALELAGVDKNGEAALAQLK